MILNADTYAALSGYVIDLYKKARNHKQDITRLLVDCKRMAEGKPIVNESGVGDFQVDVVGDRSSPLVREISSFIRNIFENSLNKPFVLVPTPIAELPPEDEDRLRDRVNDEISAMIDAGADAEAIQEYDAKARLLLIDEINAEAAKRADNLSLVISDRLNESGWKDAMIKFINDLTIYPTAILKSPSFKNKDVKHWDGNNFTYEKEKVATVENISPFDIFPAVGAASAKEADYIIQKVRLTRGQLVDMYNIPDYDPDVLDEILDNYETGYDVDDHIGESEVDYFDLILYYGSIDGRRLHDLGLIGDNKEDIRKAYELEIWVIGKYCILFQEKEAGSLRPFYHCSFYNLSNSFWGMSPMGKLQDIQKSITGVTRALIRNVQFSGGILAEVNVNGVVDKENINTITPNSVLPVNKQTGDGAVYDFKRIPSLSQEFTALLQFFEQQRYSALGSTPAAFGDMSGISSAARTTGNVAIIFDRVTQFFKYAVQVIDKQIIEPVVTAFLDLELLTNSDINIQGDLMVEARGISGLIEKEENVNKLQEYSQQIVGLYNMQDEQGGHMVSSEAVKRVFYNLFQEEGINTEGVLPDFEKSDILQGVTPEQGPPNEAAQALDGRSAQAKEYLETKDNLTNAE